MARPLSTFATLQAQSAAGAVIPSIQSAPSGPALLSGENTLQFVTVTVANENQYPVVISGDYIFVESATQAGTAVASVFVEGLTVKADTQNATIPITNVLSGVKFPKPFNNLQFANSTGNAIVLKLWIGYGNRQWSTPVLNQSVVVNATNAANSFDRPNNVIAYAANQAMSTLAGSYLSFALLTPTTKGKIVGATLFKSSATVLNANFRLFLFSIPPANLADQANFVLDYATYWNTFIGVIDFPSFITSAAGSGAVCVSNSFSVPVISTGGNTGIYAYLVAQAAYVPTANESFNLRLFADYSGN